MGYLEHLVRIAYTVIGPIAVLAGAGYLIGRRVPAAGEVLAKMLIYLFIPLYVFQKILEASLAGAAYGRIVLFSALVAAVLYAAARGVSRLRRHDGPLRGAFANTAILYNSANFGIPVMALAFRFGAAEESYAVGVQIVVAACQGFVAYTFGAFLAAAGSGGVRHAAGKVWRLPFVYALAAALILKWTGVGADRLRGVSILWEPLTFISEAYVAMALMTLGAQLANVRLVRAPADLVLSMVLRLAAGPLVGLALVKAMGLEGLLAQVLVIGAAGPSAVSSVVVAIEFKNRPGFAASAVLVSTLAAGLTVPIVIFLSQAFL